MNRFQNGLGDIPATPLLNPAPFFVPPSPLTPYSNPKGRGNDVSLYALDSIALSQPALSLAAKVQADVATMPRVPEIARM